MAFFHCVYALDVVVGLFQPVPSMERQMRSALLGPHVNCICVRIKVAGDSCVIPYVAKKLA